MPDATPELPAHHSLLKSNKYAFTHNLMMVTLHQAANIQGSSVGVFKNEHIVGM